MLAAVNCRYWLWKQELQKQLADQFGITVMVYHYPTGASKGSVRI